MKEKENLTLKKRLLILLIYIIFFYVVNFLITQSWIPTGTGGSLWFVHATGYFIFKLLSAPFFTKPVNSLATSFSTLFLLWTLDLSKIRFGYQFTIFKSIAIIFSLIILISSAVAIITKKNKSDNLILNKFCYLTSINLGKETLLFSPLVMISIFAFHQTDPANMLFLAFVWILIVIHEPVELIFAIKNELQKIDNTREKMIGTIERVDSPNIIKVLLESNANWEKNAIYLAYLANSKAAFVIPLFTQVMNNNIIGTGLYYEDNSIDSSNFTKNTVYDYKDEINRKDLIRELIGLDIEADLIGFITKGSNISNIKFEIASNQELKEGMIVFLFQNNRKIYYQILDAYTDQEKFLNNPRGTHIVIAAQLGILDDNNCFKKYEWLPKMNSPVFTPLEDIISEENKDELIIGQLPGSKIDVLADFDELLEYHTAILGVTGTGKTELAFDIIKHGLNKKTKVFCVDFTGDYKKRLSDYGPETLSLDAKSSEKMEELLFGIEIGEYSAQQEKKAFNEFIKDIRPNVKDRIREFLEKPGSDLGIFELPDIATTKATLRATELYLTEIFNWARQNRKKKDILVVLEEAHTVIPETYAHNYDRAETNLVINKISQIALQGRKYGVGLLIISQRTALVSKTILSQCNTYFSFSLVDQTSLGYLSSVYSSEHVDAIPNLGFLETLAYGKGVRSERPIAIKIPFDKAKLKSSESLNCQT